MGVNKTIATGYSGCDNPDDASHVNANAEDPTSAEAPLRDRQVGGKIAMDLTMPAVLGWVLGGNVSAFKDADRASHCRIADKPKAFDQSVSPGPHLCATEPQRLAPPSPTLQCSIL